MWLKTINNKLHGFSRTICNDKNCVYKKRGTLVFEVVQEKNASG
jgi:hypothetical protein